MTASPASVLAAPATPHGPARVRAALIHLTLSALVAAVVGALIFGLWYPGPYRSLAGGTQLFVLIAAVDVAMGPLLTLVVYDVRKPRRELRRDLAVIVALQLAALAYGVWTMAVARPTHLVFEVDLYRVVAAVEIDRAALAEAPPALRRLPWTGPVRIGVQPPADADARFDSILRGLGGQHLAAMPRYWTGTDTLRAEMLARARPITALDADTGARLSAEQRARMAAAAADAAVAQPAHWLPVVGRHATWIALLDADGAPAAFVPIDAY
jgi:hypothetical protein